MGSLHIINAVREDGIYMANESTDKIHFIMVTWERRVWAGFPQWMIIELSVLNCFIVTHVR